MGPVVFEFTTFEAAWPHAKTVQTMESKRETRPIFQSEDEAGQLGLRLGPIVSM